MQRFLNWPTRAKLFFGFGMMVVLVLVVGAAAHTGIRDIQASEKSLYEKEYADAIDIMELGAKLNRLWANLGMMMLSDRKEEETWQEDIDKTTQGIEELVSNLRERNHGDIGLDSYLREFQTGFGTYKSDRDKQLLPIIAEGKLEDAKKLFLGVQWERRLALRTIVDKLMEETSRRARTHIEEAGETADKIVYVLLAIAGAALVLAMWLAMSLSRIIAVPLKEIARAAEKIAAGDLTGAVSCGDRADEMGVLAKTFAKMTDNLREMVREIGEGVTVLGSSAGEIATTTAQVASSAAETATSVSETTTTVEEVKQTALVASQKAQYVMENSQKMAEIAQGGKKSTEDAITGMNRIQEKMETIAESIVRLSEQSQAIGEIMATVSDLSEQSNLLAVNAAIEAAKAGEQGKGFAVVAQEIRSLAEQSKQGVLQVRAILHEVQKAIGNAVMVTEQGSKAVGAGVVQSTRAGEAIIALAENAEQAVEIATQIAASSRQQLVGMDQVVLAMGNIQQAGAQNVAGARQVEVAARDLKRLGQKLEELSRRFQV